MNMINEIKNFKDHKNIYSYIENQLVYLYHFSSQENNVNLLQETVESISIICDNSNDDNDVSFPISILNSFKTFLIKKVEINENSNENSNNQLFSVDLGLLYIYKWIIKGLFNKKLVNINYHKNQIDSPQFSQLRELIETVLILSIKLLDIPEFLKTIEEQKQFNEKEYNDTIKRSNLFRKRIIIIFEIIFQFFNSEIDKNNILNLEIKNTALNQLFYRILEYKIIVEDDSNNSNNYNNNSNNSSDIISKHWTNLEISNICNELLKKFQQYYSRKYEFITNLLEYYKWSRTTTEIHFRLLGSLEDNENRWKYNSPYIHSFQMFVQSLTTPVDLFDYFYTSSSIQSHRFILSVIFNLLDCTSNDIKFIGIDIINYFKLNFNNNHHFKSFLIIDSKINIDNNNNINNNNNKDIYIKLFDIFKLFESVNQNDTFKCAHLLFDLLLVLYPITSNNLIHPNIKIVTNNDNDNNNNNNKKNLKEIIIFNNNFKKYQDIIMLLINILVNDQDQKQVESIKKLITLRECKNRIFKELGLHCIQFFNLLIPSLIANLEIYSMKSDQLLILEILKSLDEIINQCWIRIVNSNYSIDIIKSISPLYNNNELTVYNNIIISILDRLSLSFKKLNKFDKFIGIFNNSENNLKNNVDFFNLFIKKYNK
ncbi:hypothetical protein RB653_009369 [Dictyostelium firmibasis]|uniref:Uncharacterized protein n=1 Tax=Dictyostelium firmibasis TaxID=79012 RepID=A0AAN7TTZ0_9MYCE